MEQGRRLGPDRFVAVLRAADAGREAASLTDYVRRPAPSRAHLCY